MSILNSLRDAQSSEIQTYLIASHTCRDDAQRRNDMSKNSKTLGGTSCYQAVCLVKITVGVPQFLFVGVV